MCTNFEKFTNKKEARQEASAKSYKRVYGEKLNKAKCGVSFKRDWKETI